MAINSLEEGGPDEQRVLDAAKEALFVEIIQIHQELMEVLEIPQEGEYGFNPDHLHMIMHVRTVDESMNISQMTKENELFIELQARIDFCKKRFTKILPGAASVDYFDWREINISAQLMRAALEKIDFAARKTLIESSRQRGQAHWNNVLESNARPDLLEPFDNAFDAFEETMLHSLAQA